MEIQSGKVQLGGDTSRRDQMEEAERRGKKCGWGWGMREGQLRERGNDRTGLQPRCNRKQKRHRKFPAAPQVVEFQRHCHPLTPQEQTGSKAFNL